MILLDSHVLLWVLGGSERLGERARATLAEAETVFASAASIWELAIKSMLGKVRIPEGLESRLEEQGLSILDVTAAHGLAIRRFPDISRHDPFNRLLVAQADEEGLRLMTADQILLNLGRQFILNAEA